MEVMGVQAEIATDTARVRPENSEVMRLIACTDKAAELTGWRPQHSLRDGLKRVAEYVAEHLDLYKPEIYNV